MLGFVEIFLRLLPGALCIGRLFRGFIGLARGACGVAFGLLHVGFALCFLGGHALRFTHSGAFGAGLRALLTKGRTARLGRCIVGTVERRQRVLTRAPLRLTEIEFRLTGAHAAARVIDPGLVACFAQFFQRAALLFELRAIFFHLRARRLYFGGGSGLV